jgi:hypothetical protein
MRLQWIGEIEWSNLITFTKLMHTQYDCGSITPLTIDASVTILGARLSLLPQPRNNYTLHLHQKLDDINNP